MATGANIKWYASATGGLALASTTALQNNAVYYATQSSSTCESSIRTAVKVEMGDKVLEAPKIATPQVFCSPATLADVATDGSNILWYNTPATGSPLPLTTVLTDGMSYYAAQKEGNCESGVRKEVGITISGANPVAPEVITPQNFCPGALVQSIAVPNNQVVWYTSASGGTPLAGNALLATGVYYAAQKGGSCESVSRTPVTINIGTPDAPKAQGTHGDCFGNGTLADLVVVGSGIVWYNVPTGGTPLPLTTLLSSSPSFYAAQSAFNCEGGRVKIDISSECYELKGTVFPFVHKNNPSFDAMFPVTVKLYSVPSAELINSGVDPFDYVLSSSVLYSTAAVYYSGSPGQFTSGIPKYPGVLGAVNNPGLDIDWYQVGKTPGAPTPPRPETLSAPGDLPEDPVTRVEVPIGIYTLKDVAPGEYIIAVSRKGFVIRFGKITVNASASGYIGHRELLAGDVNESFGVDGNDLIRLRVKSYTYPNPNYDPYYDFYGTGAINSQTNSLLRENMSIEASIYQETMDWLSIY
jgi:hypothetical protein